MANAEPERPAFVVDGDEEDRARLARILRDAGHTVREHATGEGALEAARRETPAVVVLDVCLPGISGYGVCHDLRARFGEGLPIVFVSALRTEAYDRAAGLLVGADDYLAKPVAPDELLIRIERLIRRASPLSPEVSARLTPREAEVLRLLAEGLEPKQVAAQLVISPKTVSTHIDRILAKLGVHSRAQAVAAAYRGALV
jgi:two-component system, LuxR family, response regulator FixJ